MKSWQTFGIISLSAAFFLFALAGTSRSQMAMPGMAPTSAPAPVKAAIAVITPTGANKVAGVVKFSAVDGGVKVVADVTGLTPGRHGFHIHEFGDVSDTAKGMATGGHFGPMIPYGPLPAEDPHPSTTMHHAGEMGNLEADASGHAHLEVTLHDLSIAGPENAIIGRSIIVHAQPDVGDRIGQAVIGAASSAAAQ